MNEEKYEMREIKPADPIIGIRESINRRVKDVRRFLRDARNQDEKIEILNWLNANLEELIQSVRHRDHMKVEIEARPSVAKFAEAMEKRLRQFGDRVEWKGKMSGYLYYSMERSLGELRQAVFIVPDEVRMKRECLDIANFAMMISDNLSEEGKE